MLTQAKYNERVRKRKEHIQKCTKTYKSRKMSLSRIPKDIADYSEVKKMRRETL